MKHAMDAAIQVARRNNFGIECAWLSGRVEAAGIA
jgi:hypothetical protein